MQFIRKIINSDDLQDIVALPNELKHQKVEVLVLPLGENEKKADTVKNFDPDTYRGSLSINDIDKQVDAIRNEWERA